MNSKDIFTPKSLLPVGTMIVTTPTRREILGQGPDAFMAMWLKAVQPPTWEERVAPPVTQGIDILLVLSRRGIGKRGAEVVGSMRQKKQRRHQALHLIECLKSAKLLTNCHPVSMGMDTAAPGTTDQTAISDPRFPGASNDIVQFNVGFSYEAAMKPDVILLTLDKVKKDTAMNK